MDYMDNVVHHFDIPQAHNRLEIVARTLVEVTATQLVERLSQNAWRATLAHTNKGLDWDFVHPSHFVRFTPLCRHCRAGTSRPHGAACLLLASWLTLQRTFRLPPSPPSTPSLPCTPPSIA
jgi:hypothetical protein